MAIWRAAWRARYGAPRYPWSSSHRQRSRCPARAARVGQLIIISWRDIPAQVIVKRGRETAKVALSPRFQEAVDRAAMRAGKGSSDAYLADWKRSPPRPCGDDLRAVADAEAAILEAGYSDEDLERMIRAKGVDQRLGGEGNAADGAEAS